MSTQKMISRSVLWFCIGGALLPFSAEAQVASQGFKYGNLMLSPYVNLEYLYDSNINYGHKSPGDNIMRFNPGLDLRYKGNEWGALANVWYSHAWYGEYDVKDYDRWGERLSIYRETTNWKLVLSQGYTETDQNDSYQLDGGDGVWRNRQQVDAAAVLTHTFNERLSASANVQFTDMWYGNASDKYRDLYGYMNWGTGLEIAHKLTERSSLVLSGSYMEYYTGESLFKSDIKNRDKMSFSNKSQAYSLMGGLASRLTERVRYRVLGGASLYDYAGDSSFAPSYSVDATWAINRRWAATVAGAGYFQPIERTYYQRKTIYTLSAGTTYQPIKRLRLTLDGIYRGEDNQTLDRYSSYLSDYTRNQYSVRFRANYQLQKYVSVFAAAEYTIQDINRSGVNYRQDDWDRYLLSVGLSLRY